MNYYVGNSKLEHLAIEEIIQYIKMMYYTLFQYFALQKTICASEINGKISIDWIEYAKTLLTCNKQISWYIKTVVKLS